VRRLPTKTTELNFDTEDRAHHLPDWANLSHPERLKVIREIALARGRDPRIARLAVNIFRKAGVPPREYAKQAAALLKWVQEEIYFTNEAGERLQDPVYTLKVKMGDCDDCSLILAALFESVGMPWRLVLSGRRTLPDGRTEKLRYVEGTGLPPDDVMWVHIYLVVGVPPFKPTTWYFCEPSIKGVPLGWDVVSGDASYLPEMARQPQGPPRFAIPLPAPSGFRPSPLPNPGRRSAAYAVAYGSSEMAAMSGGLVGATELAEEDGAVRWSNIGVAVVTGVAVSVTTAIFLDWFNGKGIWAHQGHVFERWNRKVRPTLEKSVLVVPAVGE
jgi:transglutaminase-like putative cysteine protease